MFKQLVSRSLQAISRAGITVALLWVVLPATAIGAPALRFSIDEHGDFTMIGNTNGFNCGAYTPAVPDPVVGTVDRTKCGNNINDHGPDVFWRSDQPANGQAVADTTITAAMARSTSVLSLPANATVLYARLYWGAQRQGSVAAGTTVTLERNGVFSRTVQADSVRGSDLTVLSGYTYYQSSADITKDVQTYGMGVYRVGNMPSVELVDLSLDVAYTSWTMVVFYRLDTAPVRNLSLFDGFDLVQVGLPANATLQGFLVPAGAVEGRLGVLSYQGDNDLVGDSLSFNTSMLTNAANPANNFFNSTRSTLGAPVSVSGDLPQLTGGPGSMDGLDMDIVDVTSLLKAGDSTASISATTAGDTFWLGAFITAIATNKPVFTQTDKTYVNLTRADGTIRGGDKLEFTVTTKNTGTDAGVNVTLTDPLPAGMTYVAGTLQIDGTAQTDQSGDDKAEYTALSRSIKARLGTGASSVVGGSIAVGGTATVKFQVTIDPAATGILQNQAMISAQGQAAVANGILTAGTWNSGDGKNPNIATQVPIDFCVNNAGCSANAPVCDTSAHPYVCTCKADSDCSGRTVCDITSSRTCVECTTTKTTMCDTGGEGGTCLANNTCGCTSNTDCNGRVCNVAASLCPPGQSDVKVTIARPQGAGSVLSGSTVVYTVTITNSGPDAVKNVSLTNMLPTGATAATYTCTGMGGAVCPSASGQGGITGLISLPAGGSLVYSVSVPIPMTAMGTTVSYTVSAPIPPGYLDVTPANNTATDSVPLVNGPDLALKVTDAVNSDGTVTYDLLVSNNGPGTAQGASVTYDIPAGATVTAIDAGAGWMCTQVQAQVVCTTSQAIPAGSSAPDIRITVKGALDAATLPVHVTAAATVNGMPTGDNNPSDNTYTGTTTLGALRIEGGGFGCSTALNNPSSVAGTLSGLLLLGILLMQRRRRSVTSRDEK